MNLNPILELESCFTLLVAPAGWGKTTLLLDMYKKSKRPYIFVSPLRALANEFYERAKNLENVGLIKSKKEGRKYRERMRKESKFMLIATPETICDEVINDWRNPIFILDEFHLFYYWGETFREHLWDCCMAIANSGASILGLTATLSTKIKNKWEVDFSSGVNKLYYINLGNQIMNNRPSDIFDYSFFGKGVFSKNFKYELSQNKEEVFLFFCEFRHEVFTWIKYCEKHHIMALGCVGGRVGNFQEHLKKYSRPKCIFSTSALGHGVNLPEISKVFINHKVKEYDFWVQMAGRGGRRGKEFKVYGFNGEEVSFIIKIKTLIHIFIRNFFL